jgi:DNA-directed RNA polymerase subunit omega
VEKLEFIDSKFRFAILAAKRAKQLVSGAKKKVYSGSENPLTTAMEEISHGKIKFKVLEENEQLLKKDESVSVYMGHEEDDEETNQLDELLYHNDDSDDSDDNDEDVDTKDGHDDEESY